MQRNIIILSRSDAESALPKIIVRARSDKRNSSTIETIRNFLLQRCISFEVSLTIIEARSYTLTIDDLPFYLINRACSYKKPFVNNDFDYLRRSVRRISCRTLHTSRQIKIIYDIEYLTTILQEDQLEHVLRGIFTEKNLCSIKEMPSRIKSAYDI